MCLQTISTHVNIMGQDDVAEKSVFNAFARDARC